MPVNVPRSWWRWPLFCRRHCGRRHCRLPVIKVASRLAFLLPSLLTASKEIQYALWSELLHILASHDERDGVLRAVIVLLPVLESLGGRRALLELAQAVNEVNVWFASPLFEMPS